MKRDLMKLLQTWKADEKRKPLILTGAFQVGKTTLLKEFGALEYTQTLYINFENSPALRALFKTNTTLEMLINALKIETHIDISPTNTLIILDEIQLSPYAIHSLNLFHDEGRAYHVVAANSSARSMLTRMKEFPTTKVSFLDLYPLSYPEFLDAINEPDLRQHVEKLASLSPFQPGMHDKLLQYLKIYFLTGGMPEAVAEYIKSRNLNEVRTVQKKILNSYALYFAQCAPKAIFKKLNAVWEAIPRQLAKENKKFMYALIHKGARIKEFQAAVQWLKDSGITYKSYQVKEPEMPLHEHANPNFFKLYLLDVGLLGAMIDMPTKSPTQGNQLFQALYGSLVENYMAQEFARNHLGLYYWTSSGKAELDFLMQHDNAISPIQIKSKRSGKEKSLTVFAEKYKARLLIQSAPLNIKKDKDTLTFPFYLIGQLHRLRPRST